MAENAGHLAVIESSLDGAAWVEIDGEDSFSVSRERESIEVTNFKDPTGAKIRIMGIADGACELGGNVVFKASTLDLDPGIAKIVQRARDKGALYLRTKLEGSGGSYRGAVGLVEKFSLSAEVGGAVTWSASTTLNGAGWV